MANISNSAYQTLVSGTSSADSIYNSGSYSTVKAGKGNDVINDNSYYSILYGEAGNDSILVQSYVQGDTVVGGAGDDTVSLASSSYNEYGRVINYATGDGNDVVYGLQSYDTIHITKGTYTTTTSGTDVILNVGKGSITLKDAAFSSVQVQSASGNIATIKAYNVADNDSPHTVLSGTAKADAVSNSGRYVTVDAGKGNDLIENSGYYDYIDGGAGDDYIENSGYYATINAGAGNDSINLQNSSYSNVVIKYASGDGNDIISGFTSYDTLNITKGSYTTTTSGDDVILKIGKNTITFEDAIARTLTVKGSDGKVKYIQAVNHVYNSTDTKVVSGTKNRDYIYNSGSKATVKAGAGKDTIENFGGKSVLNGDDGDDLIYSAESALNVTINGGAGADTVDSFADYASISGGAGKDVIYIDSGYDVTVKGGTDGDFIALGYAANNNVISYASGDGKDTVTGFDEDDIVKITKGTYSAKASGSDVVVTVGKGSITLKDAAGKKITIVDSSGKSDTKTYGSASNVADLFAEDNLSEIVADKVVAEFETFDNKKTSQENLVSFAK